MARARSPRLMPGNRPRKPPKEITDVHHRLGFLAGIALCGLEGHLPDIASVDADRRQDPPGTYALAQSLLARDALCHGAWPDHVADPRWRTQLRDRVRFHRP